MTSEQFGKTYLQHEQDIANVLRKQRIYDEDLLHDTYIALYEHSPHPKPEEFVTTFVTFYHNLRKRQVKDSSYFEVCDDATMIEKYDRIDEDDWKQRELLEQYLDYIFENFRENPLPGIRNHERACQVLQLFREGLTFREIAEKLGIKCSTAHEYFSRAINGLKANKN